MAFSRLFPFRHQIFRSLFYPQSLVPENGDSYQLKDIWTMEQVDKLLDMVKKQRVYEPASRD